MKYSDELLALLDVLDELKIIKTCISWDGGIPLRQRALNGDPALSRTVSDYVNEVLTACEFSEVPPNEDYMYVFRRACELSEKECSAHFGKETQKASPSKYDMGKE